MQGCLFNLVLLLPPARRMQEINEMMQRMREFFPCKVIAIHLDSAENRLYLKQAMELEKSDQKLTVECVTIDGSGSSLEAVPFKILKELKPNLPIYLYWGQDLAYNAELLAALEPLASRLIFDSEASTDSNAFFKSALKFVESNCHSLDLNWARLTGWRQAIAQVFDSKEKLKVLSHSKRLTITYNNRSLDSCWQKEIQAIYLQSWLATQLGWVFKAIEQVEGNIQLTYSLGIDEVHVVLSPKMDESLAPGSILSLEVMGQDEVHFSLRREEGHSLKVYNSSREKCAVPYTIVLSNQSHRLALIQELFLHPISSHFGRMLKTLSLIDWNLGTKR